MRHALSTRLWHWINAAAIVVLFMSGLTISNAHRYLYWGNYGFEPGDAWLAVIRFPGWATLPQRYNLAEARDWHLLAAWPFAVGLVLIWIAMLANGHFRRDLTTRRTDWTPGAVLASVRAHGTGAGPAAGYNPVQRILYGVVFGVLLPLMVFSGLAISPGFEPAAPWLVDALGGRQSARSLHFIAAWAIFGFFVLHVLLALTDWRAIIGMVTGKKHTSPAPTAVAAPRETPDIKRRSLLAGAAVLGAGACARIADTAPAQSLFRAAEGWHRAAHRTLASRQALAPEYAPEDRSPSFRGNGSVTVDDAFYRSQLASGFPDWRLEVRGLVDNPLSLSLADLRALPQRVQITRHDCVEGWSAIGEWAGPQLSDILDAAKVRAEANFIIFRCADTLYGRPYYESIDMVDAYHPQTILAHALNGEPLPEKNGAPLRMRIERQLGYKHAKYVTAIEAVASLHAIGAGRGGFWEDIAGYQWYAGI